MAFFVAAIKFQNQWYTKDSVSIKGREIGPGTVIISTKSEINTKRKNFERGNHWSRVRNLLADYLGLGPDLKDIERLGIMIMVHNLWIVERLHLKSYSL